MIASHLGRWLALIVLAAATVCTFPPPAVAAGTIDISDGVMYGGCQVHPYTYTISPPPGVESWEVFAIARNKDDWTDGTDSSGTTAVSASGSLRFCNDDLGRWTLTLVVVYLDEDDPENSPPDEYLIRDFTMGKHETRTRVKISPLKPRLDALVRFTITREFKGPGGYRPRSAGEVLLEYKSGGAWRRIPGSRRLVRREGRVGLVYRWVTTETVVLRARSLGTELSLPSVSKPIKVKSR